MSFHRKFWKVRTSSVTIGYLERIAMPYWPSKTPKPKASSPPAEVPGAPITPLLFRSKPLGTPVFEGAT